MYGYDQKYGTRTVPMWAKAATGVGLGAALITLGSIAINVEIVRLFRGRSTFNFGLPSDSGIPLVTPRTWTENPFWPAAGMGFWVGMIVVAAGVMGFISWIDGTLSSLKAFILLSALSSILSFYQMITAIIPLVYYNSQKGVTDSTHRRLRYQEHEYICNTVLLITGLLGTIVGFMGMLTGLIAAGYCSNQRRRYGYGMPGVGGRNRTPYGTTRRPFPTAMPYGRSPVTARPYGPPLVR